MVLVIEPERAVRYGSGRDALIEATIRVVANHGLRGLTNRTVAEEAGVTHGLVSHHFGSRDALISAALRYEVERSVSDPVLGAEIRTVDEFADNLVQMVDADADGQAFLYELILEGRRNPELADAVRAQYDEFREATRRQLERLGLESVPGLHLAVFACLDGLVLQYLAEGRSDSTREAVEALRYLLRAVGAA